MRDAVLVLLILAVAVGWFSLNGPREAVDGSGLGPGDDRMGESPLAVSGPGAESVAVTVTQSGEREAEDQWGREREKQAGEPDDRQEPGEENTMGDATLILVGCAVGTAAVLIGMFAGPMVARMWQKVRNAG